MSWVSSLIRNKLIVIVLVCIRTVRGYGTLNEPEASFYPFFNKTTESTLFFPPAVIQVPLASQSGNTRLILPNPTDKVVPLDARREQQEGRRLFSLRFSSLSTINVIVDKWKTMNNKAGERYTTA